MIKEFVNNNSIILIIIGVVLVLVTLLIIILNVTKKEDIKPINIELFDKIYNALGGNQNIESVEQQQDRVRLILKDVKTVDSKVLSEEKIPAFLKENEIKLLFRENSLEFVKYRSEERRVGKECRCRR